MANRPSAGGEGQFRKFYTTSASICQFLYLLANYTRYASCRIVALIRINSFVLSFVVVVCRATTRLPPWRFARDLLQQREIMNVCGCKTRENCRKKGDTRRDPFDRGKYSPRE